MRDRRCACGLIYPVLLLGSICGCQLLHPSTPVALEVRDAETKEPIAGAEITIDYPAGRAPAEPKGSTGVTDADGVVRLRAAPEGESGIMVEGAAKGYLFERVAASVDALREGEPASRRQAEARQPPRFVLELYAEPGPTVELTVPNGYRGFLRAAVEVAREAPSSPGQRCFRYQVTESGQVLVRGGPLLQRLHAPDFRASYADGTPLPQGADPEQVGLRWQSAEGNVQVFIVGTQRECENICRTLRLRAALGLRPPQGAGGEGQHRRRARGE